MGWRTGFTGYCLDDYAKIDFLPVWRSGLHAEFVFFLFLHAAVHAETRIFSKYACTAALPDTEAASALHFESAPSHETPRTLSKLVTKYYLSKSSPSFKIKPTYILRVNRLKIQITQGGFNYEKEN